MNTSSLISYCSLVMYTATEFQDLDVLNIHYFGIVVVRAQTESGTDLEASLPGDLRRL
jgi:hypothetical protein